MSKTYYHSGWDKPLVIDGGNIHRDRLFRMLINLARPAHTKEYKRYGHILGYTEFSRREYHALKHPMWPKARIYRALCDWDCGHSLNTPYRRRIKWVYGRLFKS